LFLFGPNLIRLVFKLPFLHFGRHMITAPSIGSFEFITKPELYYMGLFFLGFNIVVLYLLYNSKIGKAWDGIHSSLKLAQSVGVDVVKYRIANMVIGNFLISLAGSYLVAYNLAPPPLSFNIQAGGMVMMYAFIGGLSHSFWGPILGSAILVFIPEYLRVAEEYEPIITSVLTIIVIIVMPDGILGWIDRKVLPWIRKSWKYPLPLKPKA
jgi:branched-chain amino acid transport system permease protein